MNDSPPTRPAPASPLSPTYDAIGRGYTRSRRTDPRIADALSGLLDLPEGSPVADIGAVTGNYTRAPTERGLSLVAVESSPVMCARTLRPAKKGAGQKRPPRCPEQEAPGVDARG